MLVHLPADRGRAYLVSFPRDAWVPIQGHGNAKLNAAFSFGGPPLLIATIERLTGVRVDHFAILDFDGFRSMTDALGGVKVRVARTVRDPARKVVWPVGTHHLDGARALDFVRQRHNLPGGDLGRIKRQQAFLKALAGQVVDKGTLANPLKLNAFLEASTKAVSVDESLTISRLRSLALQFRSVRAGDLAFVTVPVAGTGTEGRQSVVYLDRARGQPLYQALRTDAVEGYLAGTGGRVNQVDEGGGGDERDELDKARWRLGQVEAVLGDARADAGASPTPWPPLRWPSPWSGPGWPQATGELEARPGGAEADALVALEAATGRGRPAGGPAGPADPPRPTDRRCHGAPRWSCSQMTCAT